MNFLDSHKKKKKWCDGTSVKEDMNSLALTVLKASRRAVCLITDPIYGWKIEKAQLCRG